ncbi:hypothetical protein AB1K91_17770 [Terribacillus sp. 179-K 1B1 HS]|uniref:hypothetical protein n=1 Tax=Terribacillus sp. 179-K 1B1 HS TaxID=3142388 RepID=UPI0039A27016
MESRKERRQEAKANGVPFTPIYAEGFEPKSYKQATGIGYERFDNKFVKISELTKEDE